MATEAKERISTGIILPAEIMEKLDVMAVIDMRDRSAEIAYLVSQEWERRKKLETPTTPIASKRKA